MSKFKSPADFMSRIANSLGKQRKKDKVSLEHISACMKEALSELPDSESAEALVRLIQSVTASKSPAAALRILFTIERHLYLLTGKTAIHHEKGVHPKHRLTNYHGFFIDNVRPGERVIEIGSGKGTLAFALASQSPASQVIGVELSEKRVTASREKYFHPKLSFVQGDATKALPEGKFDVLILSNLLEHLENRPEFLSELQRRFHPDRFLIRVPQYDRDWRLPLKHELGLPYLYPGHFIEYTRETFVSELAKAGLKTTHMDFRWGEIWSVAHA